MYKPPTTKCGCASHSPHTALRITSWTHNSRSFEALYTIIKSSLSPFFSRVGSFSLEILSSYGKSFRLGAIFVAVLCILSIFFI